jgi:hypothetical protein
MDEKSNCGACRYARKSVGHADYLECRCDPPAVSATSLRGAWPLCLAADWCGHFSPGAEPAPAIGGQVPADSPNTAA